MICRLVLFALLGIFLNVPATAIAQQRGGPPEVIITAAQKKEISDRVEALGTTRANETVSITADTAEKVTAIHFEDGQMVKKDDLLLTLDMAEEEADLRSAEAVLAERQSAYNRANNLQENSALSKATLQERDAALRQAQAQIESIKARISEHLITAPFDGILGLREVSVGTLVQPGDMITTIDDLSRIKVDFEVPSVFLNSLKPGLKIVGRVEAFGDREFAGEVSTVNTQVDPVTRSVRVRAILPNPDMLLKPGLLMSIILLRESREAVVIPEEALIKRGIQNFVYIVQQNEDKTLAVQKEVKVGARQPGEIEITEGLSAGERIISHGMLKLTDGSEIKIRAEKSGNEPLEQLLQQETSTDDKKG